MLEFIDRLVDKLNKPLYYENEYRGLVASVIISFGKDKLDEIEELCKNSKRYRTLLDFIRFAKTPKEKKIFKLNQFVQYKRNEPISLLIKWFQDSRSGKRGYARAELKRRFITQSRNDQVKIIKSLLHSNCAADRDWAAIWADRDWSRSFTDGVKHAINVKPSRSVTITAINNLPAEYIIENIDILGKYAPMHLCLRLGKNPDFDFSEYELNMFEYLYVTASLGRGVQMSEEEVKQGFFQYIYEFILDDGHNKCLYPISFFSLPLFSKAIWALGQIGMTETLMSLIDCVNYVFSEDTYSGWITQFDRTLEWIRQEYGYEEVVPIVDNSDERLCAELLIGDLITSFGQEYNDFYAELGLSPISVGQSVVDNDFSEENIENNPFE